MVEDEVIQDEAVQEYAYITHIENSNVIPPSFEAFTETWIDSIITCNQPITI